MGSLPAVEEDDAAKRHSRPPRPHQRPFIAAQEVRAVETVINGTTWYHHPPPPPSFNSDSHAPLASSARYGPFTSFNSVSFDGSPSSHHNPHGQLHHAPNHNNGGGAFGGRGIEPQAHVVSSGGCAPYYRPEYSYGVAPHGAARGVFPGHLYSGMGVAYGAMPGYSYNGQQNQGMPYYPYNGHAGPYMPPPNGYCMTMPITNHGAMQGPARAPHGGHMMDYTPHHMPPHAIRTRGKTLRQIVTWSGMSMPVTVTSQAAAVVDWIQRQTGELFGFDLEWKPNRLKDEDNLVALLQICGQADCLIIQLLYTDMVPKMLREFLSSAKKRLGGVGIRQDVLKLERDHDLVCQGQVELGSLASEKLQRNDLQGTGLKRLVDQVLGMTLVKVKKITMSNWEKEFLDEKQIEYACIDAWAAYAILHKLMTL
ncbi:hypothetical protein GOP47_0022232 [Adiantum capillus-veneris]|uniref:3'-5' exonuclease domain-containing protein n=1 Tax=Adiantum capillus-veneris TaxID=13818 RepID=A0A9D4Z7C4_ADICA|nr:hypothetical protein GOP47_0022232 [Adiantum capillus-veneris]